jgi:pyrroline-5-carboxylate reductase
MLSQRIGFIGAGQMATALAQGLTRKGLVAAEQILASDVSQECRERFTKAIGARTTADNAETARWADVVVLAVKPQHLSKALAPLRAVITPAKLVISIAAGVRLTALEEALGAGVRFVRVMPNTPCLVGEGACAFALGKAASPDDEQLVQQILSAVGMAIAVDEKLLDAVTGLSGSGPAYVYMMIEALSDGGVRMGLPRSVATQLAAQTLRGAAQMVLATGEHPGVLKDRVTSPGGTTIAGVAALEAGGMRAALIAAVEAATRRSVELAAQS